MKKFLRLLSVILIITLAGTILFSLAANAEENPAPILPWDGSTATEFEGGTGSENSPFIIATAPQFAFFRDSINNGNFSDKYFILGNDIHLGDKEWIPIGSSLYSLKGLFDGCGYTISNFHVVVTANSSRSGLFSSIKSPTTVIQNFKVANAKLTNTSVSGSYVGIVLGYGDGVTLRGISIENTCKIESLSASVGSIAGRIVGGGVIEYCKNEGEIAVNSKSSFVGGIAGVVGNNATVRYSTNIGKITFDNTEADGTNRVGGVVGINGSSSMGGTVEYCYNNGEVICTDVNGIGKSSSTGGVIGATNTVDNVIKNSYNLSTKITGVKSDSTGSVIGGILHVIKEAQGNSGVAIDGIGMYGSNVAPGQEIIVSEAFVEGTEASLIEKCKVIDDTITDEIAKLMAIDYTPDPNDTETTSLTTTTVTTTKPIITKKETTAATPKSNETPIDTNTTKKPSGCKSSAAINLLFVPAAGIIGFTVRRRKSGV